MAKKDNNNLADLTLEQLQDKITETKLHLKKMKFAHAIQPLENPMEIRYTKKDIARMMTELTTRNNETQA